MTAMDQEVHQLMYQDRSDIGQLILRWGYYRDHGMWEQLSQTFHPDGQIQVTWYVGAFDGFVTASKLMAQRGVNSRHVMKPSLIDVDAERAIAITPVSIVGRAVAALGVEVDLISEAQFLDFLEKKSGGLEKKSGELEKNPGEWRISRRVCIYQKDRMDSVLPSLKFWFMSLLMPTDKFDPAYKHLGMVLSRAGYEIQPGQVVDNTDACRALYQQAQAWLHKESA